MTDAQTDAAMVALAPHHDGCRCRHAIARDAAAPSRCW
jgi:hypothetical protein